MNTTISIRTDSEVKEAANEIFKKIGLDMSTAVNIFLRQVVISNGIPFSIQAENKGE